MHLETETGDEREEQVDRAVVEYLRAEAAGQPPDREQFLQEHSTIAEELQRFLADRDEVARLAAPLREAATPLSSESPADFPAVFGAYELLEEVGRGGMGVVYRARQPALNRVVALKMIAPEACGGPGARARFRTEAQAAARLQHPNVVQIFEVGEQQGRPFLVLEYVGGGSLARRLEGAPLASSAAARMVETLAHAVHTAHLCGVIHRDLKPANVLLTPNGIPKVADFGLAKQMDGDSGGQTETGAILGTPSYMAPEQAEGGRRPSGPATDVYALGALLYELLTGRPPFRGVTRLDTLHQVVRDEPVPPRRLQPGVPRDLETVCLKCLQKEPRKRYDSALSLAEDLRRFGAGEPVLARPAGWVEVAWRWCRRRPAQAILGASLLLALAAGGSLVVWQWRRAEDNFRVAEGLRQEAEAREKVTEGLRQEAVAHEAEVEDSFFMAHDAVKDFLKQAGQEGFLDGSVREPQRRALLSKAQLYYRKFLERRGRDATLRRELAEVSAGLADVTRQIGSPAEALADYRHALGLFEELAHEDPDSVPLRIQRAILYDHVSAVLDRLGQPREGLDALEHARGLLEEVLRKEPDNLAAKAELANVHHNMGMIHRGSIRLDDALAAFAHARAMQRGLFRHHPEEPDYQAKLANTLNNIGVTLMRQGRPAESLKPLRNAVGHREQLALRFPEKASLQNALAETLCNLADSLRETGALPESVEAIGKALVVLERLARANPSVTAYRLQLGLGHANAGLTQMAAGDAEKALASFEQARKVFAQLAQEYPQVPDYQLRVGQVCLELAEAHARMKRDDLALRDLEQGREVLSRLVEAYPSQPEYASRLASTLHNLSLPLERQGRLDEVHAAVLQAVEQQRRAFDAAPQDARYKRLLAHHYARLSWVELQRGQVEDAVAATDRRLALRPNEAGELYDAARDFALTSAKGKPEIRRRCADLALGLLRRAVAAGFRDARGAGEDPAFECVRSQDDFKNLLAEMGRAAGNPRRSGP